MISSGISDFLIQWHLFTIDYYWRKKYKIPFGSSTHREMNWMDMAIEFTEDDKIEKIRLENIRLRESNENKDLGLEDSNTIYMTKSEIDEEYDNLDLSKFNDHK